MVDLVSQSLSSVVRLAPLLTIREIAEQREVLLALLQKEVLAVVDCSAVEKADVSLVQLLIATRRMAERDGLAVDFNIPASGVVAGLIRQCGVAHCFEGIADD